MTPALRHAVFAALSNADQDGYSDFVRCNSLTMVALDLFDCDADIAAMIKDMEPLEIAEVLAPMISEWREVTPKARGE